MPLLLVVGGVAALAGGFIGHKATTVTDGVVKYAGYAALAYGAYYYFKKR